MRLYVLDCGTIRVPDPSRFRLTRAEVAATDLAVPCFLVVHGTDTLMWDVGAIPDGTWVATGGETTAHIVLADSQTREVTVRTPLVTQLAAIGYAPAAVTYLALSHYHYDHTANANAFAGATWLVRQRERDAMFAEKPPPVSQPATYAKLRTSTTHIIERDDYDVFGDGTVVIKSTPGHTPGHQSLLVNLVRTGGVLLSGDLYHYPEERVLDRVPTFEFDAEETRKARTDIEAFLRRTHTQLWIQHDLIGNARLKKAPEYYD